MTHPTRRFARWLPALIGLTSLAPAWAQTPTVPLFEPTYGTPGDPAPIVIFVGNVANSQDIQAVFFNSTPATIWAVTGMTEGRWQIQAQIPQLATTGPISVRARGITGSSTANFLVFGPGPRPLFFTPTSGRTNTVVTITGDRFITGTRVYFKSATGEIQAVVQTGAQQDQLFATVPDGAITGKIRVSSSQGSNETVDSFTVIQNVDLQVQMHSEPTTGVINQSLTLVTTVTNASAFPATGVVVTNGLNPSLTYISGSTTTGAAVGAPVDGVTTAIIGNLPARASAQVRLIVQPTVAGQVTTTGGAYGNEPDPNETNNSRTLQTTIITSDNNLALGMSATSPVYVGETMTYTIVVTNLGPLTATGIEVVDTLPAQVQPLTVTTSQGVAQTVGQQVTALLGGLTLGRTADVRITVNVLTATPFSNTATVTAAEPDPNPANNTVTLQTTPEVRSADLGVSQTVSPNPPAVGEVTEYRLSVTNRGPELATQVRAIDVLSTNVLYVSASSSQGTVERTANVLTAQLGSLPANAGASVTIRVIPKSTARTTNQVDIASLDISDPIPANNRSVAASTPVVNPTELGYQYTNQVLVLTWPTLPEGWKLQHRSNLQTNSIWTDYTGTTNVSGLTKWVEVDPATAGQPQTYYRLILR